jgi:hypothetical protein
VNLPEHKCGLFLSHNEHRGYYEKIADFIESLELEDDFESKEALRRSIDTDELWVLQWYPDTPTGFLRVAAPTLVEVLAAATQPTDCRVGTRDAVSPENESVDPTSIGTCPPPEREGP